MKYDPAENSSVYKIIPAKSVPQLLPKLTYRATANPATSITAGTADILKIFFQNRGIIISQHFSFPQCANSAPSLRTSAVCPSVSGRRGEFASTVFDFSTRSIFASLVITG